MKTILILILSLNLCQNLLASTPNPPQGSRDYYYQRYLDQPTLENLQNVSKEDLQNIILTGISSHLMSKNCPNCPEESFSRYVSNQHYSLAITEGYKYLDELQKMIVQNQLSTTLMSYVSEKQSHLENILNFDPNKKVLQLQIFKKWLNDELDIQINNLLNQKGVFGEVLNLDPEDFRKQICNLLQTTINPANQFIQREFVHRLELTSDFYNIANLTCNINGKTVRVENILKSVEHEVDINKPATNSFYRKNKNKFESNNYEENSKQCNKKSLLKILNPIFLMIDDEIKNQTKPSKNIEYYIGETYRKCKVVISLQYSDDNKTYTLYLYANTPGEPFGEITSKSQVELIDKLYRNIQDF